MTREERELLHYAMAYGPYALVEDRGMSAPDVDAFLSRPDVRDERKRLEDLLADASAAEARRRYFARRAVGRMVPQAVQVISDALRGNEYVRDSHGNLMLDQNGNFIVREPMPTKVQVDAAKFVLSDAGIGGKDDVGQVVLEHRVSMPIQITYPEDARSDEEKAMSRERVRNAIMRLAAPLLEAHREIDRRVVRRRHGRKPRKA